MSGLDSVRCEICREAVSDTRQCANCFLECCSTCMGRGERFCCDACMDEYEDDCVGSSDGDE